jgi:septal ring factor EnvC (AmiA/AmiB activator)
MTRRATLFAALFLAAVALLPARAGVAQTDELREAIQHEQDRADQRQQTIERLEKEQRDLRARLARVEAEVRRTTAEVREREEELARIEAAEAEARRRHEVLRALRERLVGELRELLRALWPVHAGRLATGLGSPDSRQNSRQDSWQETDRRFAWLAAIYEATAERMRRAAEAAEAMRANLEERQRLALEAAAKLGEVNDVKDRLLRQRLELLAGLRRADDRKADLETDLRAILDVIKDLNYKLQSQRSRHFADNRKLLPWPVEGQVISTFAPGASPPRRGIGISSAPGAPVRSVFWGKVLHADVLRGFGRVVIVYHGDEYYSVYAYLAGTSVAVGQEVEKDEPIGTAGLHPKTKSPGLYFELRFGAKPISPVDWLSLE